MTLARAVRVIASKELRETLRDRKTLIMTVLVPLVVYPLVFLGISQATLVQQGQIEAEAMTVGIAGGPAPAQLAEALRGIENTEVREVADARRALAERAVLAAVDVGDHAIEALGAFDRAELHVLFDGSDDRSREAERRVRAAIDGLADDIRQQRLDSLGIRAEAVEPVLVISENTAPPARQGGWLLGQILPMLVSFLMIGAAFYPAIDLTAGEKERGTLQTLLTAPISPLAIVFGKFVAVVALALMTGVLNVASMTLVVASIPLPEELAGQMSFQLDAAVLLLLVLCLLLLGMMLGAVMMAVAVTARSFKEAQNYLTPLYLACIFPLAIAGLPGVGLTPLVAALPLVNLAVAMRELLVGTLPVDLFLVVVLSTTAWIALALVLAARVFRNEAVMLGDAGVRALFQRRLPGSLRPPVPTVGEAVTLLGVVLLLLFYGSVALAGAPVLVIVHATQWGLLLLPTVAVVRLLRLDARVTFALRRPPTWALSAAVLLGGGLWYAAHLALGALVDGGFPAPGPHFDALFEALGALAREPLTAVLLFAGVAVAPAICEELLFRGVVLQSLRRSVGAPTAVLLTAALFGLFHLNLAQLPTTVVVGLVLGGLVVLSGSIWPAMLLHALHNGVAVAVEVYGGPDLLGHPLFPLVLVGPSLGLGLLLHRWHRRSIAGQEP